MLGTTVNSFATLFACFNQVFLEDGSSFCHSKAHVAVFAAPARNTVAGTVDTDTVGFALFGALQGFFASRASKARRTKTFTAEAVTTGRFDHFVSHRHVRRLTGFGTRGVHLDTAVGAAKAIETKAFPKMANTALAALVGACWGFQSDGATVCSFVAWLASTDTTNTDTVVVARASGTWAGLSLSAIGSFKTREAFALALDAHPLARVAFLAASNLAVLAGCSGFAEAPVELANTLSRALVLLAETNFNGAVSTRVSVQAEAATVAAQTVVVAILGAGLVLHHLLALFAVETCVAHAFSKVANTPKHAVVFAHIFCLTALARKPEVAEAVAMLAHTMLTNFA
mmetsp:Transcript_13162/g.25518  ORF Transcript_13162/g.25518 Transcript_13162/m.25518 type:complete len:342 (-) Transcript_13162:2481-3506(-)